MCGYYDGKQLYVNEMARQKTGDMYMTESRFYSLAVTAPLEVIYEQMRWIGKEPRELQIQDSTYLEERRKQFVDRLLIVQNYTNVQLQKFKENLVSEYHKEFFKDLPVKGGTISLEKLKIICERMGLVVIERINQANRNKLYSIRLKEKIGQEDTKCY